MTLTAEKGLPMVAYDSIRLDGTQPGLTTNGLMDASGEKVAICGCVWHPTVKSGTINIRKVHFLVGAKTLNAASVFQVSLQSLSDTAGPPYQPDGTADQTASLSALTANAMNSSGNLSADRAVDLSATDISDANSRWLAIVFEYTTFTAADSVVINGNNTARTASIIGGQMLLNTGSWAVLSGTGGIVVLECDDGTFAFLHGCAPWLSFSSASVSSTGAIRRAGNKFRFPTERKLGSIALAVAIPNGCDGRLVLYDSDGTTELASVDIDNDAVYAGSLYGYAEAGILDITLAANTYYRLVFVGGTTTSGSVHYGNVNAAGHMDGIVFGQDCHWTQHDGSSWTETTTRRAFCGLGFTALHNGSGGGSALHLGALGQTGIGAF